jgi:hypothetical protein
VEGRNFNHVVRKFRCSVLLAWIERTRDSVFELKFMNSKLKSGPVKSLIFFRWNNSHLHQYFGFKSRRRDKMPIAQDRKRPSSIRLNQFDMRIDKWGEESSKNKMKGDQKDWFGENRSRISRSTNKPHEEILQWHEISPYEYAGHNKDNRDSAGNASERQPMEQRNHARPVGEDH